jgi:hypothetical protein
MSPVKYELGFYISEDDILHSDHRENLKSYTIVFMVSALRTSELKKMYLL